jgi:hypothetical protein
MGPRISFHQVITASLPQECGAACTKTAEVSACPMATNPRVSRTAGRVRPPTSDPNPPGPKRRRVGGSFGLTKARALPSDCCPQESGPGQPGLAVGVPGSQSPQSAAPLKPEPLAHTPVPNECLRAEKRLVPPRPNARAREPSPGFAFSGCKGRPHPVDSDFRFLEEEETSLFLSGPAHPRPT